jgi:hypothetical protein
VKRGIRYDDPTLLIGSKVPDEIVVSEEGFDIAWF